MSYVARIGGTTVPLAGSDEMEALEDLYQRVTRQVAEPILTARTHFGLVGVIGRRGSPTGRFLFIIKPSEQ